MYLKKLKKELKFLTKPWITQGLQNSVKKTTTSNQNLLSV